MEREEFIKLLADFIQKESIHTAEMNEPYRAAGDKLVDEALALIP